MYLDQLKGCNGFCNTGKKIDTSNEYAQPRYLYVGVCVHVLANFL